MADANKRQKKAETSCVLAPPPPPMIERLERAPVRTCLVGDKDSMAEYLLLHSFGIVELYEEKTLHWGMDVNFVITESPFKTSLAQSLMQAFDFNDTHERDTWLPVFESSESVTVCSSSSGPPRMGGFNYQDKLKRVSLGAEVDVILFWMNSSQRNVWKFSGKKQVTQCFRIDQSKLRGDEWYVLYDSRDEMFHRLEDPTFL